MSLLSLIPGKPWLIGIAVVAVVGGAFWGGWQAHSGIIAKQERTAYREQIDRMTVNADKVAKISQEQTDEQMRINAGLADDLERLRDRKPRVQRDTAAACEGATGAELSVSDASFLVREAARADQLRNALIACYAYADTVEALR